MEATATAATPRMTAAITIATARLCFSASSIWMSILGVIQSKTLKPMSMRRMPTRPKASMARRAKWRCSNCQAASVLNMWVLSERVSLCREGRESPAFPCGAPGNSGEVMGDETGEVSGDEGVVFADADAAGASVDDPGADDGGFAGEGTDGLGFLVDDGAGVGNVCWGAGLAGLDDLEVGAFPGLAEFDHDVAVHGGETGGEEI